MSTSIKTITGSCHIYPTNKAFDVQDRPAELYLTRFYNGKKGTEIQLTIRQSIAPFDTSYIHLSKEQCEELAKVLQECFDYEKYPSE